LAGYSGTPLVKKLGLKEEAKGLFVAAPEGYEKTLGPLPGGFSLREIPLAKAKTLKARAEAHFDFIHVFCRRDSELQAVFVPLKEALSEQGMIWVSWPKRTASAARTARKTPNVDPSTPAGHGDSALDEHQVRAIGLKAGLVDVKVCAVDDVWSGLKFVYRLKDRKK
jgi:hypothetical protein